MRAVVFLKHGGPEVLEYTEVPTPDPAPGEILVKVRACALNHLDIWLRQGIPAYKIKLPHISGCDAAGTVERLGQGVSGFKPGDPVVLIPRLCCGACDRCRAGEDTLCADFGIRGAATDGGYAEFTVARAKDAFPLPKSISFEQAAAFPLVFMTAWHMLIGRAKLQAGETVLVHGAGSGVGHAGIQIARHVGARVFTTTGSAAKAAKAKELGAEGVIDYSREVIDQRIGELTGGKGVNVVLDHIGPETWEPSIKSLAKGGRLVTCGATTGPQAALDLRYVYSRQLSILGSMMGTQAEFSELLKLVGEGKLMPIIDTVYPLKEARVAQEKMLSRAFFGKLILSA